jgi:hypothetical protein
MLGGGSFHHAVARRTGTQPFCRHCSPLSKHLLARCITQLKQLWQAPWHGTQGPRDIGGACFSPPALYHLSSLKHPERARPGMTVLHSNAHPPLLIPLLLGTRALGRPRPSTTVGNGTFFGPSCATAQPSKPEVQQTHQRQLGRCATGLEATCAARCRHVLHTSALCDVMRETGVGPSAGTAAARGGGLPVAWCAGPLAGTPGPSTQQGAALRRWQPPLPAPSPHPLTTSGAHLGS